MEISGRQLHTPIGSPLEIAFTRVRNARSHRERKFNKVSNSGEIRLTRPVNSSKKSLCSAGNSGCRLEVVGLDRHTPGAHKLVDENAGLTTVSGSNAPSGMISCTVATAKRSIVVITGPKLHGRLAVSQVAPVVASLGLD